MSVITISREFGAGGSSVAALVAAQLGHEVIDRSIVGHLARRLGLQEAEVEAADERPAASLASRILDSFKYLDPPEMTAVWQPPYPDPAYDPRRAVVRGTEELIAEAARGGAAVIVGRGAAFVLGDRPGVLHVFLRAPQDLRARIVMDRTGLDEAEARRRMHETDANRAAYIRQLYHADWHDMSRYHLVIDTARVGFPGAATLIVAALREGPDASPGAPM